MSVTMDNLLHQPLLISENNCVPSYEIIYLCDHPL